jgi:3-isopropylmalate/(R)-2-methylmalate dehydratase small subunit
MEPFKRLDAVALPLAGPNIDTDQIIPARFLWRARATGYGELLFNDLRYLPDGGPDIGFVLNEPTYSQARVLVAERNFGCGSSREQAVWALADYGFRAVIAPSFGDIFYNNCCSQGVLPIALPEPDVLALQAVLLRHPGGNVTVDLERQTVEGPDGWRAAFEIPAFRRKQLLEGLDDVAVTLGFSVAIEAFEGQFDADLPWLATAR